ncbi:MAG: hypothetical protein ACHQF2_09025, partial [Flavobacteriales bacterium]
AQLYAQEPSSFYFTGPQPKGADFLSSIPKNWQGTYRSEKDTTLRLYITRDSIYTEAPIAMLISMNEAQGQGYAVLDSVIVVDNDTLPCWVHEDTAYFFIYVKKNIYKQGDDKKLFAFEDYLLLSSKTEKGDWETTLFIHQGMAVEVGYFDHSSKEGELQKKKKIKREDSSNGLIYRASFKEKEWKGMYDNGWFPYQQRFNKTY